MAKHVTEQQYNGIKRLIQKHPSLNLKELSKLSGFSPRTVCLANTTDNFAQYKEKIRKWNHKGKTNEIPTDESHVSVDACQTQIEQIEDLPEYNAARLFRNFRTSLVDAIDAFDQLMTDILSKVN